MLDIYIDVLTKVGMHILGAGYLAIALFGAYWLIFSVLKDLALGHTCEMCQREYFTIKKWQVGTYLVDDEIKKARVSNHYTTLCKECFDVAESTYSHKDPRAE